MIELTAFVAKLRLYADTIGFLLVLPTVAVAVTLWARHISRPTVPGPTQFVRWIECRGCMGNIETVQNGVVLREYMKPRDDGLGFYKDTLFLEIRLENGDALHFPKAAFYVAPDGVLEYRW